jgi:DNA ligase-associated metallophosphoesterase
MSPKQSVILENGEAVVRGPSSSIVADAGSSDNRCAISEDDGPCFAYASTGDLQIRVAGTWAALLPSGALWIEAERTLVCADLHLEKGSAYAARGQMLPPYDTRETLRRLALDVAMHSPDRIVLLGDTLHDGQARGRIAERDAEALGKLAVDRALMWVVGNHDPDGPGHLPGRAIDTLTVAGLRLRHDPQPGRQPGEAAGHLHPCARIMGGARSVRRRCFVTDGLRLILPAYGAYAGGLSVRDPAFAGLFARPPLVGAIGSKRVHPVKFSAVAGG